MLQHLGDAVTPLQAEQIKKIVNEWFSGTQENPMPNLKSLWV